MIIKHSDLYIDPENPFSNCQLNREQYANILTQIVDKYKDGFVMSINNQWGTGKTTFVKMWKQVLENQGHKTVYFNAWENDFEDNALTAIMGELSTLTTNSTQSEFKEVLKKGAVIAKNILPGLIKATIARYVDVEELKDFGSDSAKAMAEIFEADVNEYANKKANIGQFRDKLEKFVSETNNGKPLVFIIDELDRCRPNYSVAVLEQIKHFFSVKGIVFILSIDKEQLGNAIRGVYGTEKIDADEYLKRFIDVEYTLPNPDADKYIDYLYKYFEFESHFGHITRQNYYRLPEEQHDFIEAAKILLKNLTLRQQHKILGHCRLSLNSYSYSQFLFPVVFLFLVYIRTIHKNLYDNLKSKSIDIGKFHEEFFKIIKSKLNADNKSSLAYVEAVLIYFAHNYYNPNHNRTSIITKDSEKDIPLYISKVENDSSTFLSVFKDYLISSESSVSFAPIFDKIDLLAVVKVH